MFTKLSSMISRILLVGMVLTLWNAVALAQDVAENTKSSNAYGPMFAILLGGVLVILVLGFLMNARDSVTDEEK